MTDVTDIRRTLALLLTATSLALCGAICVAAPAAAAPSPRSVQNLCLGAHPGHHLGWVDHSGRNVGGTCPAP